MGFNFEGKSADISSVSSDGEVLYNNGGVIDSDPNLYFDDGTETKRLGIQVGTTPQNPLHVAGSVGETIGLVTGAVCTRTAEVIESAPTHVSSALYKADDLIGATPTPTQNTGGSGFTASGQTIDYIIQPYITIEGIKYGASDGVAGSFTDPLNDASSFAVDLSWSSTTSASGYIVKRQVNGGGYSNTFDVGNLTSWQDTNATATDTTTAWPSTYISNVAAPADPASFDSATQNDAGGARTSNGTWTIKFEVKSYFTFQGTQYSSDNAAVLNPDFTDANNANNFTIDLSWTTGGGAEDGYIYRYSEDGGSTWSYIDVGNNTTANNNQEANEPAAATLWANNFTSAFNGTIFYFKAYGITSAPDGYVGGVFSSSSTDFSVTVPNDNLGRILYHTFSSVPASGYKLLGGAAAAYDEAIVKTTATFFDPGYNAAMWDASITVTPIHYGHTGVTVNRTYRIYTYKTSGGVTFYSSSYVEVSMTDPGSGYHFAALSWTLPSGATGVRIIRSINGGAYDKGRTVAGSSTVDVSTTDYWSSGSSSTTVTPTSLEQIPFRFDKNCNTSDTRAIGYFVSVGAADGTRLTKVVLGHATSTSGSVTERGVFGTNTTHQFYIDPGDAAESLLIGTYGNPHATISATGTTFNALQSSSNNLIYKTGSNATALVVDTNIDTVMVGSAIASYTGTVTAAMSVRSFQDADDGINFERRHSQTGWFIRMRNSSGANFGGFDASGYLMVPTTGSLTVPNIRETTGTTSGFSIQASQISAIISSTAYYNTTVSGFDIMAGTAGLENRLGGVMYITNTQTGNVGTGEDDLASYSVPANTLSTNGHSLYFEAYGTFAATANNKRVRVRFGTSGTNLIFDTTALVTTTSEHWYIRGIVNRTGSATQKAVGIWASSDAALPVDTQVVTGLNQTLSGAVTLKVTGEATSNNDIVLEHFVVGWRPNNT